MTHRASNTWHVQQADCSSCISERFHSSFIEFTLNGEAEASNPLIRYLIDPQMAHQSMAERCLSFLNEFLASFRGRECRHSDLRGVELYTVKFWPLHLANSNDRLTPLPPKLKNLLLELPENYLRRWGSWFLTINIPAVGLSRSSCDLLTYIHLFTVCFSCPHISVLSVSLRCEYLRILIIITLLTFT